MAAWPWHSSLKICGGCDIDDSHQAHFDSIGDQQAYFDGKVIYEYDDWPGGIDETKEIRAPLSLEDYRLADYVVFETGDLDLTQVHRVYFRIQTKQYKNPDVTLLTVSVDPYQTYMFQIEYGECFVEREMITPDWPGNRNHVSEPVPLAEPVTSHEGPAQQTVHRELFMDRWIVICSATEPDGTTVTGSIVNGVYSGNNYYWSTSAGAIDTKLKQYATQGKENNVSCVMMVPFSEALAGTTRTITIPLPQPTNIDNYAPKNAKLRSYPYCYLNVSNWRGDNKQYRYEYFDDPSNIRFNLHYAMGLQPAIIAYPLAYKGVAANPEEGITLSDFPQCSWTGDATANFLAQNRTALATKALTGVLSTAAMAATGNVAGAAFSAYNTITSVNNTFTQAENIPEKHVNPTNDVMSFSLDAVGFVFSVECQPREHLRRQDSFMDAFGYNVLETKVPSTDERPFWNYVKTRNCVIHGSIPPPYQEHIQNMFNRGVTLWHISRGAVIGDYSMDNRG